MGKIADFFAAQRLALTARQTKRMLGLDAEFAAMGNRVAALQAENRDLRGRLNPLPRAIERLRQRVWKRGRKPAGGGGIDLDRREAKALTYIALHVLQAMPSPDLRRISAFLELVPSKAEALLAGLQERKLVHVDDTRSERLYSLTERGKDYLVRTKVLNVRPGSRMKKANRKRARSARGGQSDRSR